MPIAPDGTVQIIKDQLAAGIRHPDVIVTIYAVGDKLMPTRVWAEHFPLNQGKDMKAVMTVKEWGKGRKGVTDAIADMLLYSDTLTEPTVTMSPAYQAMFERGDFDAKR